MMLQRGRRAFLCESAHHKQGGKGWRDSKVERNRDPLQSSCSVVPKAMKLPLDPAF